MSSFPDRIHIGEILLRPMVASDMPMLIKHFNDPKIARWMAAAKQPFSHSDAEEILKFSQDPASRVRVLENSGAMIGCLCLSPDVWFWLDPGSHGQGLMSCALRAAIAAHFADPAPPLMATCRDDNYPSQALLSLLGFSRMPIEKRMFFHAEGCAQTCHGYVMTSGQWMQLHPPVLQYGPLALRPATQKDAPTLALMLPRSGSDDTGVWPSPETLCSFIELHRCRAAGHGLFVIEDEYRRVIGMVLRHFSKATCPIVFLTDDDAARCARNITSILN